MSGEFSVPGQIDGRFVINKFGRNPDIDTGSLPEDIWDAGGVYTGFPTGSAEALRITSSSAADAAAGTGARTVRIYGLDGNYAQINEDVTLNGTSNVVTTQTFLRVYRALVATAGSGLTNAGDITIRHNVTTGNIFSLMLAGKGQAEQANYTIPAGFTGYMVGYSASMFDITSNNAELAIFTRDFGGAVRLRSPFVISETAGLSRERYRGLQFNEKTDLTFRCYEIVNSNGDVTVSWDMLLVPN